MSEGKAKISVRTWIYVIVYTIVLAILMSVATLFIPMPWASGMHLGASAGVLCAIPLPIMIMLLLYPVMKITKIELSTTALFLLYASSYVVGWRTSYKGFYTIPVALIHARIENQEIHGWALPYFWIPSAEAVRASFYPNLGAFFQYINEWIPVIFTWTIWYLITLCFQVGLALVYRRLWIDIEVMPFPHAQGWLISEIITGKRGTRSIKATMIGVFVGFLAFLPYVARTAYAGFPDLYGWLTSPNFCTWAIGNFYPQNAFPSLKTLVIGPLSLQTNPFYWGFLLLVPLDSLFSLLVACLLFFWLIPQILFYFGYYSGITTASPGGRYWMIQRQDPLKIRGVHIGMIIGTIVFHIVMNWRYYLDTIKYAISGETPEGEVSYRVAYSLIIIGAIGLIIIFSMSNIRPWVAAYAVIVLWLLTTAMAQSRGYSAMGPLTQGRAFMKWIWGEYMEPAPHCSAEQLFLGSYLDFVAIGRDTFGPHYAPMAGSLDIFAMAKMAKIDSNTAFRLIMLVGFLTTIIVVPTTFIGWYYFGLMKIPASKEWDWMWTGDAGNYNNWPARPPWWPHAIAGIVLAIALVYMRLRYAWWPLEPFSFLVVPDPAYLNQVGLLTPLPIWIIKYVIIKFGGRRAYEEYCVPFALGLIGGTILAVFVISLIALFRYFMP
ncbi:MAG: hypothetical protein DRO40_10360 [Thermoprotei archaeon]|nr:MAG: hypothetical protein DRO40_10360 [Thermoprotei archaeon]